MELHIPGTYTCLVTVPLPEPIFGPAMSDFSAIKTDAGSALSEAFAFLTGTGYTCVTLESMCNSHALAWFRFGSVRYFCCIYRHWFGTEVAGHVIGCWFRSYVLQVLSQVSKPKRCRKIAGGGQWSSFFFLHFLVSFLLISSQFGSCVRFRGKNQ